MVLLNFPQLEWMLFYFAPANYHYYSWHILKWARCQRESSGLWEYWWTWLYLPSSSRATPTLPSTLQRCCRVSSSPSEQLFGFAGLFSVLDCYLVFGWCSSACQQGLLPSPPCLAQLAQVLWGCTPQCGHCVPASWLPLVPSTPVLRKTLACIAPWQWAQTFLSSELGTMKTGPHGGPIALAVLQTPTVHPHCPQPFHVDWARVWRFLCQMWLILSASPRGQQVSALQHLSLLALRKGPKLSHLLYGANGCLWLSYKPLQWRRLRRDGYGWCAHNAQRRGYEVTTVIVKEDEPELGWVGLGVLKRSLPIYDWVILYKRQFKGVLQSQREW